MNILKRTLAMMLVLCMLLGMVPFTAFASENTDPTGEATESVADVTEGENHQPGEMARFGGKHGKDKHSKDERPEDETTVSTEVPVVETTVATEPVVETTEATEAVEETTVATESVVETTVATEPVVETTEATEAVEETTTATEPVVETTVATEPVVETTEATEPTVDPYGIMTLELEDEPATTALTLGTKPADGTVTGEPFNTAVSANYRIPGLVNHNGTLIATADARWDYEKDGGGMDLVVSRSTNGSTWNYTFAGYLGDNGNVWNADSTTLMDPVIISDGSTLYLLADMYPAGYSISSSSTTNVFSDTATGFDASGNLLLSGDSRSTYVYYLKDGSIYSTDGTQQEAYTVDTWFNLYQAGTYVTNLFFSDSPFQVRATSYIAMLTSTDGGVSWSAPTLLNVKPTGVSWMVLGPGSGLALDGGNIAFTAYDGSNIYLIWGSNANGWNRVSTSAAANESSIIELNDGTIRAFVKRTGNNTIAYVDFTKSGSGYTAGGLVDTGVTNFSTCMVSSLHYSKTYQGKEVVLVCCPSKPGAGDWNGRFNGKIHMFTLDDNNAMTLVGSYALNGESEFFAYSNMAEMNDGTIGVLYEDDCISYSAGSYTGNASHITYTSVNLETAFSVTFDEEVTVDILVDEVNNTGVEVALTNMDAGDWTLTVTPDQTVANLADAAYVAYDVTITKADGSYYKDPAEVTLPLGEMADKNIIYPFVVETDGTVTEIEEYELDDYCNIIFTAPHFSVMGIAEDDSSITATETVTIYIGDAPTTITDKTGNYESAYTGAGLNTSVATVAVDGTTAEGKTTVTALTSLTAGAANTFYIQVSDGVYLTADAGTTTNLSEAGQWYAYFAYTSYCTIRSSSTGYYLGVDYDGTAYTSQSTLYMRMSNGKLQGYYSYIDAGTPVTVTATDPVDATDITITGVSEGTTSVVVGTTRYNISVQYRTAEVNVYTTATKTATVTGTVTADDIAAFNTAHGSVVTAALSDDATTLTFTGVSVGTVTDAVLGNTKYTISVTAGPTAGDISDFNNIVGEDAYSDDNSNATYRSDLNMAGKVITKLTISENASFNLNVDVTDYESIEWSVADTSIATVDENGVVTGVKEGETTVTATVTKNGKIESITIPVVVKASLLNDGDTAIDIFYYIENIENTTPYYTMFLNSKGTEPVYKLVEAVEGEVIYLQRPANTAWALIWTAAPDDDHALALMGSTGTINEYYPLRDADGNLGDGTNGDSEYYYTSASFTTNGAPNNAYKNVILVGNDGNVSWLNAVKAMLDESLVLGCDGALSSTRWDHDGVPKIVTSMTFISDPVPTIDKTVDGILPTTRKRADYRKYTDGMVASVGELVYFKITVTLERPTVWADETNGIGAITYSNSIVSDTVLNGAYIYDAASDTNNDGVIGSDEGQQLQTQDITAKLNAAWGASEQTRTIELYLVYQIKTEDIPKFIIDNVANLNTNYQSEYSTGVSARKADATASITVVGRAMDNIVIDFGQKVKIAGLTDDYLKGVYTGDNVKYSAKYGTVAITKNDDGTYDVTYTPTSILQGTDAVWLYGLGLDANDNEVEKIINGFIVYPATTVYYEEGFLFNNNSTGWTLGDSAKATMVQEYEPLGKSNYDSDGTLTSKTSGKVHEYGYDDIYDRSNAGSGSSYAVSSTAGAGTSFTFTGTGFELYANSSAQTGFVAVYSKGELNKLYSINTVLSAGSTDATNQQGEEEAGEGEVVTYYSLPIISETALPYGEYTVQIKQTNGDAPIQLDGVRIYNTLESSSVFTIDEEDNPVFYELRDCVLNGIGVENLNESEYIDATDRAGKVDAVKNMAGQVYNSLADEDGIVTAEALVINSSSSSLTTEQLQDLLDNGPKNELYLYPGQSLTFKVTTDRVMQLGLKAPTGSAEFTLTVDGTAHTLNSLTSTVDMFYKIAAKGGTTHTVSITVSEGSGVLSVTKLKICDDPNFSFTALTQDDIEATLMSIYGLDAEEETPTEPEAPTYTMVELKGTDVLIDGTEFDYTGEAIEPAVTVNVDGTQLVEGRDYSVTYTNNVEPGTATVTVRGIATASETLGYTGEVSIDFTINAPEVPEETEAPTEPSQPVEPEVKQKDAELKITYINLFGRKVGSVTLTKTGNENQRCIFSGSEISANAPAGRRAVWFLPIVTTYGNTVSIVVPVI